MAYSRLVIGKGESQIVMVLINKLIFPFAAVIFFSAALCLAEKGTMSEIPIPLGKYFGNMGERDYPITKGSVVEVIGANKSGIIILSESAIALRSEGSSLIENVPIDEAKRINDFRGSLTINLKADNKAADSKSGQEPRRESP